MTRTRSIALGHLAALVRLWSRCRRRRAGPGSAGRAAEDAGRVLGRRRVRAEHRQVRRRGRVPQGLPRRQPDGQGLPRHRARTRHGRVPAAAGTVPQWSADPKVEAEARQNAEQVIEKVTAALKKELTTRSGSTASSATCGARPRSGPTPPRTAAVRRPGHAATDRHAAIRSRTRSSGR